MERFQELREEAKKRIALADRILTRIYPVVNDPRLLMSVVEHLFFAMSSSMGSVLHYEKVWKRAPRFEENFRSKLDAFKMHCTERYGIDNRYLMMMRELANIVAAHRKSPMEFSRNDKLVICSEDYEMKILTFDELKRKIDDAKIFIEEMSIITAKDEGIFR